MLPVSGALQLNTSGAQCTRPMISHSGAYSRLLSFAAVRLGQNRFHSPAHAPSPEFLDHASGTHALPRARFASTRRGGVARWIDMIVHEALYLRLQCPDLVRVCEFHVIPVASCFIAFCAYSSQFASGRRGVRVQRLRLGPRLPARAS